MNIDAIPRREDIVDCFNEAAMLGSIAEIGINGGAFLMNNMQRWAGRKYYAVDPWSRAANANDAHFGNIPQSEFDSWYESLYSKYLNDDRVRLLRCTSESAARIIPDDSLVMAYIDANHSPESVSQDIQLWLPKVQVGGWLAGHDYDLSDNLAGLKRVVDNFALSSGWEMHLTNEPDFRTWIFVKK